MILAAPSSGRADWVSDLGDVEQGGNTRQQVLAEGGGGGQQVGVAGRLVDDEGGQVFSGLGGVVGGAGNLDQADAVEGGGLLGSALAGAAGNEDVDVATDLLRGGHGVEGGGFELLVVVFGNDEDAHDQITLASFLSLLTRSATSATLMPALRLAGSTTFSVVRRGVPSTPRSAGLTVSSGFFLAFMMLGSVA